MLIYKVESTFRIIVKWVADKISRLFKRCLGRIVLGIIVMYDLEAGIRLFCLSGTCFFFFTSTFTAMMWLLFCLKSLIWAKDFVEKWNIKDFALKKN